MYQSIEAAKAAALSLVPESLAKGESVTIAIVNDQLIANTEGCPDSPYSYCPLEAVAILHRFGTVEDTVFVTTRIPKFRIILSPSGRPWYVCQCGDTVFESCSDPEDALLVSKIDADQLLPRIRRNCPAAEIQQGTCDKCGEPIGELPWKSGPGPCFCGFRCGS